MSTIVSLPNQEEAQLPKLSSESRTRLGCPVWSSTADSMAAIERHTPGAGHGWEDVLNYLPESGRTVKSYDRLAGDT